MHPITQVIYYPDYSEVFITKCFKVGAVTLAKFKLHSYNRRYVKRRTWVEKGKCG